MLGSFMDEMNITAEQFEVACLEGRNLSNIAKDEPGGDSHSFSFHKGLFQQIWAANDIKTFVRMMVQRNVEIQLQALDLIERRQASLQGSESFEQQQEENASVETAEIEKTVESEMTNGLAEEESNSDDKFKRLNLFFDQERIKTSDVTNRAEYLRAQRDKILQIKKQARARQLNDATSAASRPKSSARAAQKIIDGENVAAPADDSSAQFRLALARKLREEVVNPSELADVQE